MTTSIVAAGVVESPAGKNKCTTLDNNNSNAYINDASDELRQLQNNPLIKEFASVRPDIYQLIKATNPTLLVFIDLAQKIMECGE